MPPGPKRKRGDRTYSYDGNDGSQRPSPHRPGNLGLAQQHRHQNDSFGQGHHKQGLGISSRGGGSAGDTAGTNARRASRGGRGGSTGPNAGHIQHSANAAVAGAAAAYANAGGSGGTRSSIAGRGGRSVATPAASPLITRKSSTMSDGAVNVDATAIKNHSSTPASSNTNIATNVNSANPSHPPIHRSQPSQPNQPTPPKPIPKPRPKAYAYELLNDERVASWTSTGKESYISAVMEAWASKDKNDDSNAACNDDAVTTLSKAFQEMTRAALDGRIPAADAGSTIKDILDESSTSGERKGKENIDDDVKIADVPKYSLDPTSLFLDTISILTDADHTSPALKPFMLATGIPASRMREELETPILVTIGLLRDTFARMGIRKTTNILYRQSNYNLLREETEGYSKLITEYFSTSNSGPPTGELVTETFQRILALIGAFDLDVGRVLDVTLDVFANLLVKNYRFFIKLLRTSSWWPERKSSAKIFTALTSPNGDKTQGQALDNLALDPLPQWALPGAPGWQTTDEERETLNVLKEKRDSVFWYRVREIGISAFFELGNAESASKADPQSQKSPVDDADSDKNRPIPFLQDENDREWTQRTGTYPPVGNRTAAQLLGFKLRFYASAARSPQDTLPDNLIHLAALMIKTGFISLRDLYPHLYPSDEAMEGNVKERLIKEKAERDRRNRPGAGSTNALVAAGALSDDTVPPSVSRMREIEANSRAAAAAKAAATTAGETGAVRSEAGEDTGAGESMLPEPVDQKIHLLKSLLLIGALPEALFILGKFPWLMDLIPDMPDYLHRILNHSLSKIYEPLRPLHDRDSIRAARKLLADQSVASAKGDLRFIDPPPRKILRWANLDKNDSGDGIDYRFYWEEWADNIPMCQSVEDVFLLCSTLLNLSGVKIGRDPDLLMKLSRIGKYSLSNDMSESNLARWVDLSKRLLVPALSLTKTNPGLVNEMYDLLKFYPIRSRFNIYAEWYTGQISRMPDIKAAFDIANAETKIILKRISKTNTKPMARALAKIAYASPGIVFEVTLNQIEAYENLIEVVVECARYFTYLGYDVLTWSLMNAMGGGGRVAVESDGMMTKQWLKMLAIFAGRVFKRYSVMSPAPILQFVANQLRSGNVTGLDVLEQMINFMAGIRPDVNFNEAQIQAMAGGELLQTQTLEQLYNQRIDTKTSSKRLLKALTDPCLAVYMLIAVAQVRQTAIFRKSENNAPPKVLGNSLDRIHRVFIQYLDMLRSNLSIKDFDESVPDVVSLIGDFRLDANAAFAISRPSISYALAEADAALKAERQERAARASAAAAIAIQQEQKDKQSSPGEQAGQGKNEEQAKQQQGHDEQQKIDKPSSSDELSVKPADEVKAETTDYQIKSESVEIGSSNAIDSTDTEMKDAVSSSSAPTAPNGTSNVAVVAPALAPWKMPLSSLIDKLKVTLPEGYERSMSISFYATFWQLSLHDMLVPSSSYEDEIKRQRDKIAAVSADRTDLSAFGMKRKEARKKELNELQDRLRTELKSQIHKYSQVRARLQKEKDCWFADFVRAPQADRDALHDALLQECFLPRALFSSLDALYTFKMIFYLHASGAPGFSTADLLDRIFREKQLTALIFYCTLQESESLGRFLSELLKELRRWHADPSVYEKMASGPKKDLPGFAEKLKEDGTPETFIGYEDFRRRLLRWHKNVTGAFKTCLSEGEYMRIRNAVNVLKPLPPHYPVVEWMGNNILELLRQYEKDPREDIKVSTMSLLGELQKRKKGWIIHAAFSTVDRDKAGGHVASNESSAAAPTTASGAATSAANAPTASTVGKVPNGLENTEKRAATVNKMPASNIPNPINTSIKPASVTAPEFQSQRKSSTSRSIKTPTTARSEFEDGEIDDIRSAEPRSASNIMGSAGDAVATELNKKVDAESSASQSAVLEVTDVKSSMPAPPPRVPNSTSEGISAMSSQANQAKAQPLSDNLQQNTQKPDRQVEPVRTQGGQSAAGRTVHALPQRPEQPLRRHQVPDRPSDRDSEPMSIAREGPSLNTQTGYIRSDRRSTDGRDIISSEHRANPVTGDRTSQRVPEQSHGQGPDRARRDLSRQQPREQREPLDEREMKPPPRDLRSNGRDTPWLNNRPDGSPPPPIQPTAASGRDRSRSAAYASEGPSPASVYGTEKMPLSNHERSQYSNQQKLTEGQQYSKPPINSSSYPSDRVASHPERLNDVREREGRRERVSRPQSTGPRAAQGNYSSGGSLEESDRRNERYPSSDRHSQRSVHGTRQHDRFNDRGSNAPTGPRDEQRLDRAEFIDGSRSSGRFTRGRELFNSSMPPRQQQDPNHGRLSQDPNYGRLTAEPDTPQGPRGRVVGRGNRNFTTPQSTQPSQRSSEPGSQDGPPPTMPNVRDQHVSIVNQNEQSQSQSSSLPLPSPASDTSDFTGIHPSRLVQFQEPNSKDLGASQAGAGASMNAQPSPSSHAPRQRPPPARETAGSTDPSTPNFRAGTNAYPSSDRRSEDKRFAGLQNVLQQGRSPQHDQAERGTSILGRASRQGSFHGNNPSPAPSYNNRRDSQDQEQRQDRQSGRTDSREVPDRRQQATERVTRLQSRIDRSRPGGGADNASSSVVNNDVGVGNYGELRRVRSDLRDQEKDIRERGSRERGEGMRMRGDSFHQRGNRHIPGGGGGLNDSDGFRRDGGGSRIEQSQQQQQPPPASPVPPPRQQHHRHQQQNINNSNNNNNSNWSHSRNPPNYNNSSGGGANANVNINANGPRYTRDLRSRQSMNFQEKRGGGGGGGSGERDGQPSSLPPPPPLHPLSSSRSNNLGPDSGLHGGHGYSRGHGGGGVGGGRDRRDRESRESWEARDGRKRLRDGGGGMGGMGGDAHHGGGAENKRARRSN